jgi:signal transduction histidine kinase/CheY-like chemotaxis protein
MLDLDPEVPSVHNLGGASVEELFESGSSQEITTTSEPPNVFVVAAMRLDSDPGNHRRLVVLHDVTAERLVERQLHQQERLAAVGQLAAGMAHDLNNMLQGIGLCGTLLERAVGDEHLPDLETLLEFQSRAATLIKQVLDFSRRSESQKQAIHLVDEIDKLVPMLRSTLPSAINLRLNHAPGLERVMIEADPVQLHQIVANLVVNSRDAMPSGGEILISISPDAAATAEPWICLSVTDDGEGIPYEVQSRVFDPFFSTKPVGEGTGLGLSQVYGIVNQHGGSIDLTSAPGSGTTLRLSFPRIGEREEPVTSKEQNSMTPRTGSQRLLVVEDEAALLSLLCRHLERLGYTVAGAGDGSDAIDWLDANPPPRVVLCDVAMPTMSGTEVLREIRRRSLPTLVVLMSGNAVDRPPTELEPDAWLMKPFKMSQLEITLDELLNDSRSMPA